MDDKDETNAVAYFNLDLTLLRSIANLTTPGPWGVIPADHRTEFFIAAVNPAITLALLDRLEADERTLAAVKALLPSWFAEPSECDPAHRCDGKVGCGASSCFASELMAAIYGEDVNKWPRLSGVTEEDDRGGR